MKKAVLSLSGGMDSSTLLLHLLSNGYEVIALSFDYGQKHRLELERAKKLVKYINSQPVYTKGDEFIRGYINHQVIKLDGLQNLLNSTLVVGGKDVPEGHYEQENMKETVVPNRNKIFSSIIQAVALSISKESEKEVLIAMGIHAGDHAIYPDCRQEFRDADFKAFIVGNWGTEKIAFYTPYLLLDKYAILKDGQKSCEKLLLSFNKVYKNTNTSYKPIKINNKWYSDYKSASSVERVEAFIKLGKKDPVLYADETGPVSWETVKKHVGEILNYGKY